MLAIQKRMSVHCFRVQSSAIACKHADDRTAVVSVVFLYQVILDFVDDHMCCDLKCFVGCMQ